MTVLLAFGAMLGFGLSDFLGGLSARRIPLLQTLLVSQIAALLVGWAGVLMTGAPPHAHDLLWGGLAGLALPGGFVLFYYGFAKGRMSEVAPLNSITALLVPTLFTLIAGASFSFFMYAGMACAGASVLCLAQGKAGLAAGAHLTRTRARLAAIGGGVLFGCFYILIRHTSDSTSLWPVVSCQTVCASCLVLYALLFARASIQGISLSRSPFALAAGVTVMLGNFCFLYALEGGGFLPVLVTIAQLAPAVSVILAQVVLRERLRPIQYCGLVLALLAVVLINGIAI